MGRGTHDERTRIKVCCIASVSEAQAAVRAGVDALGLVSVMPSGPGVIDDPTIARVASSVPRGVDTFLLTARTEARAIADQLRALGTTTVQVVAHIDLDQAAALPALLPAGTRYVQVVHVTGEESIGLARRYAEHADALLLDSGRPDLPQPELGGTGRAHDWSLSARIVAATHRPVFLAGGLTPANVAGAVATVAPHGVDVCSGLRSGGALDGDSLRAFVAAVDGLRG